MDIEIILLSIIIATHFIVFIISAFRESAMKGNSSNAYQKESGPRGGLVNFIGNFVANKSLTPKDKKVIYKAMYRNIADMESDGVYFDKSLKEIVLEQIEELKIDDAAKDIKPLKKISKPR